MTEWGKMSMGEPTEQKPNKSHTPRNESLKEWKV